MKKTLVAVLAAGLCACGGKSSNGSGSTGTGTGTGTGGGGGAPAATVTIQVNLVGAGTGRVTSQPAGIDCPGACAMTVAPGTPVTLTATADASSHFEGYGGGTCSGVACAFTADATTKPIFANFTPLAPNPVQHTVTVSLAGDTAGVAVQSAPSGIHCLNVCSASFAEGTKIDLTVVPAGDAHRVLNLSWSGACTGSADCSLTLTADAAVTATFTDPCAGIAVPPATAADLKTFVGTTSTSVECLSASTDAAGNVYLPVQSSGSPQPAVVTSAGATIQGVAPAAYLQTGFQSFAGIPVQGNPPTIRYDHYGPDGAVLQTTAIPFVNRAAGPAANGGSVVALDECDGSAASEASNNPFHLLRYDDTGALVGDKTFTLQGCPSRGVALVDAAERTLLVFESFDAEFGVAAKHLAGRWFDGDATAVTDWFDLGAAPTGATDDSLFVRPLIGGGAALRVDGIWRSTIASGTTKVAAPPSFFAPGSDVVIVLGKKAYAVLPAPEDQRIAQVVEAGGQTCGALPTNGDATSPLFVGRDGTYLALNGATRCTATYYPQLLK